MVSNLVFRWPKPLFFMVLGAHGGLYKKKVGPVVKEGGGLGGNFRNKSQYC